MKSLPFRRGIYSSGAYVQGTYADGDRWARWFRFANDFGGYRRGKHADQRWHPLWGREEVRA